MHLFTPVPVRPLVGPPSPRTRRKGGAASPSAGNEKGAHKNTSTYGYRPTPGKVFLAGGFFGFDACFFEHAQHA